MYLLYRWECMVVTNSYPQERKYHYRLLVEFNKLGMKDILDNFQKPCNSFYFQNILLTLLHLVLVNRLLNISYVDAKIQRLLILSLLSEQFQSLGEKKMQNQDYSLVDDLTFVPSDSSTSKRVLLILFPPNTFHLATVLPILFTLN